MLANGDSLFTCWKISLPTSPETLVIAMSLIRISDICIASLSPAFTGTSGGRSAAQLRGTKSDRQAQTAKTKKKYFCCTDFIAFTKSEAGRSSDLVDGV